MGTKRADPYDWTKKRIGDLVEKIELVKNDNRITSPGQIWSIKKLLALDYYIESTHAIFKKYFHKWYYVDTHCGSGMIGFQKGELSLERFPGSPLIASLRREEKPFSGYLFSDIGKESVSVLKDRLVVLKDRVGVEDYSPKVRSFSDTAKIVKGMKSPGKAFLIFIDPEGYTELQWNDVKQLLSIDKADIFITFMSYSFALNRPHEAAGKDGGNNFDGVFGTDKWRKCSNKEELLGLYLSQIRTLKRYVEVIPIFKTGEDKLYDLIFASNNTDGAGKIMTYIKRIMDNVTTEIIEAAMRVTTNKSTDLDHWIEK